jgi:Transposase domain (DUF772)
MREAAVNVAVRWFCGFSLTERLPDHSVIGMEIEEAARFPVRLVIGDIEVCPRVLRGVSRPEGRAGFTPGRALHAIRSESYGKTYATADGEADDD